MENTIKVYTDGACSGNPGPGGWGSIIIRDNKETEMSGFEANTTNNRMELTGVIQGLTALGETTLPVTIYTDSQYVVNAINQHWIDNWQIKGWINASKKPVANRDLWERIIELNLKYKPTYVWVKGHSTNEYNNRCDALAVQAIQNNR
ncbi:MAG: ribonuclease HI, partial [Clostridia bacterium]|nr:ribonuclease HI [Clostridia bacterium]